MNMEMTAWGGNPLLPVCVALPFAGGLAVYGIGRRNKRLRDLAADLVVLAEFLVFLWLFCSYGKMGRQWFALPDFCGFGLYLTLDGFRALYGLLASFMWLVSTVFSGEYLRSYRNRNRYYLFTLFTLGGTAGGFLSGELLTTFLFFELMSFTSYVWVVHDETKEALRAGGTYLAIAVGGGLVLLMGLFLLYTDLGVGAGGHLWTDELMFFVLSRSSLPRYLYPAGLCLLIGFGAKAGASPLHIWLPKAHPVAPAPASALLSGMLTKAGVFGVIVVSCGMFWHNGMWGTCILLLGVVTMVLGAVLALFSVNIKRTLACSSLSQIGFILVGIGMCGLLGDENVLAARGALLHMVNHSLIKLVLFLAAGVIYQNLHRLELNEIRGFGRNKPLLHLIFLAGALGIGGVPLWNGYVSKTLLHESIVEYGAMLAEGTAAPLFLTAGQMQAVEWIFLLSGALTVAYMLKLYVCIFVEKNQDAEKQKAYDARRGAYLGRINGCLLAFCALLLTAFGMLPGLLMNPLADMGQRFFLAEGAAPVRYFSPGNLQGALISLSAGVAVYLLIVRLWMMRPGVAGREYCNRLSERLDLEVILYRPLLLNILPFLGGVICRIGDCLVDTIVIVVRKTVLRDSALPYELPEGTPITHAAGLVLDHLVYWGRLLRSLGKEEKPAYRRRFEHRLAVIHSSISEYNTAISRSMSFGLFLFCVGFLLTVIYLLVYYYF